MTAYDFSAPPLNLSRIHLHTAEMSKLKNYPLIPIFFIEESIFLPSQDQE